MALIIEGEVFSPWSGLKISKTGSWPIREIARRDDRVGLSCAAPSGAPRGTASVGQKTEGLVMSRISRDWRDRDENPDRATRESRCAGKKSANLRNAGIFIVHQVQV